MKFFFLFLVYIGEGRERWRVRGGRRGWRGEGQRDEGGTERWLFHPSITGGRRDPYHDTRLSVFSSAGLFCLYALILIVIDWKSYKTPYSSPADK